MMNDMYALFISTLTPETAIKLAKKYGVNFTMEEAKIIVPFIKAHKNELKKENKAKLMAEGKKVVAPETYRKIEQLINRVM
ncbi:MAG TPA: hypothetical protein DCY93_03500 [Firmicutes bacterium]|nr:hypothetical protein [Bacillota bacterium]